MHLLLPVDNKKEVSTISIFLTILVFPFTRAIFFGKWIEIGRAASPATEMI
jgi:hypothetical protein